MDNVIHLNGNPEYLGLLAVLSELVSANNKTGKNNLIKN